MDDTKQKLEDSLTDILVWLKETATTGTDFVSEQAPIVCQEITIFGRIWWTLLCSLFLIVIILGCFLFRYAIRKENEANELEEKEEKALRNKRNDLKNEAFATGMISLLFFAVGAIGILSCSYWCLLAWFAPRLYIIDYLKDLF